MSYLLGSTHITRIQSVLIHYVSSLLCVCVLVHNICGVQELEKMASDLSEQKKSIEDAAKVLREEKDTTET